MKGGAEGARREDRGGLAERGAASGQSAPLLVPEFEPLPEGMFRRELEPMLRDARKARARAESCDVACVWREVERENFAEDVAWHEAELQRADLSGERREKLGRELEALKASRMVWVRGPLTAQAVVVVRAWSARIEEIERALAGVRR